MNNIMNKFSIDGKVCVITGGAGLLGRNHAKAVIAAKGIPVLIDISKERLEDAKFTLEKEFINADIEIFDSDITNKNSIQKVCDVLVEKYGHVDVLINNAANNPKMESKTRNMGNFQFENFPIDMWDDDIKVGLTGALICSQVFGEQMTKQNSGVILNISSDLGIVAPDQRIYRKEGIEESNQIIKPITYSVIKHALIGMTKYIATYYAEKGVRCNSLCPAGVENGQDEDFKKKLTNLIPVGRMAMQDEYQNTIIYMISDASSYMTGATVIVDGGRTCW